MKKKLIAIGVGASSLLSALPVLAEEGSGTANSAVVSNLTGVANDMVATGNSLIPVALTVVTLSLVIVFGIKFFKKIINK